MQEVVRERGVLADEQEAKLGALPVLEAGQEPHEGERQRDVALMRPPPDVDPLALPPARLGIEVQREEVELEVDRVAHELHEALGITAVDVPVQKYGVGVEAGEPVVATRG